MWKRVKAGAIVGGVCVPIFFMIASQLLAWVVSEETQNEFLISLNALKVTFWPSSLFEMFDPTSERNWKLIGLASLVNAVLYGALGALYMQLRTTPSKRLTFWFLVIVMAGCAAWSLAGVVWPVLSVGVVAAVHMVLAKRRAGSE